ncbi:trypsin-like serine peptidase [Nocardiopsis algeriensis]|uniref:V8-like Glu-specific endopeptidase n=1 Tax=Nocardiopsis algeriensis TaxID=1478215 RepID=A0A841IKY0_9ACTN|nr:trypsin-like peptidase domain-containing protein [Nocardiopsis algeriensis]MBB6118654.1 V8-like Glu-specific endopeptidase [Nocardiopsis algeriensis]
MISSTAHKILAPLAAAALVAGGTVLLDRAEGPAQALHTASVRTAPGSGEPHQEGVAHQAAAVTEEQDRAVLDYWTLERMAAARPVSSLLEGAPTADPPAAASQAAPRADSPGAPWSAGGRVVRTTGKVYLTMDGTDLTCTASVVDARNRSTLITAGHCVKDGRGSWARNWTFVPAYADGETPHGRYTARDLLVPPQWSRDADDSYDFAMAVLNTDGGTPVQDRVGAQQISFSTWTADRVREGVQVYAFGYPAVPPYDGSALHYCSGRTRADSGGTTANGMRCDMTQGSSGGPWFTGFDTGTGTGTIASVVSFKYEDDSRTQYGPRLGAQARELYESAAAL